MTSSFLHRPASALIGGSVEISMVEESPGMDEEAAEVGGAGWFDGRVPPPTIASIETTMYCNLECPMCFQFLNGTTVSGPHMDLQLFEKIAREVFPVVEVLQPSVSGEPLMSRGLDRMLELAKSYGVRLDYTTNGTLLTRAMIRRILPTLGQLFVSFDGATRETFERLRKGASFDQVVENVRALVAEARKLPARERPVVGLNCTLMRSNIEELPALVELAHDLGVDVLSAAHVWAPNEETQAESLARHRGLAAECVRRAATRARELGMALSVQPLDQIQVAMADAPELPDRFQRAIAQCDGVVESVGSVSFHLDRVPPMPTGADGSDGRTQRERRAQVAATLRAGAAARREPPSAPIWTCEYLWNKLWIGREGAVSPCCVPGIPVLGNLQKQSLEQIWNGESYRALRAGLAARDPAPCCRGCQYVQEISDPDEIDRWLQGRRVPATRDRTLPHELRPVTRRGAPQPIAPIDSVAPPILSWDPHADADGYEVELSLDEFRNVALSTTWHGIELSAPSFPIPEWAWNLAPLARPIAWRALAVLPRERAVVATGTLVRSTHATAAGGR